MHSSLVVLTYRAILAVITCQKRKSNILHCWPHDLPQTWNTYSPDRVGTYVYKLLRVVLWIGYLYNLVVSIDLYEPNMQSYYLLILRPNVKAI